MIALFNHATGQAKLDNLFHVLVCRENLIQNTTFHASCDAETLVRTSDTVTINLISEAEPIGLVPFCASLSHSNYCLTVDMLLEHCIDFAFMCLPSVVFLQQLTP